MVLSERILSEKNRQLLAQNIIQLLSLIEIFQDYQFGLVVDYQRKFGIY